MVDRADPNHLTIDVAGEGPSASSGAGVTTASSAAQRARPVTEFDATESPRQVQPNTLSTMGAIEPNTISTGGADQGTLDPGALPSPSIPGAPGLDAATAAAIAEQLSRLGITVDPAIIAGGQMTMDGGTLDLRPDTVASVLADGIPGTAFIRGMTDTGVNVRGESLLRLTLDVKGAGWRQLPGRDRQPRAGRRTLTRTTGCHGPGAHRPVASRQRGGGLGRAPVTCAVGHEGPTSP